ncbi:MAG: hypothetical protein LBO67_04525, partial [Spirochaetaceae bacterium]|nr:hypothetical protein [Spirochaetaceae bacterium]
MSASAHIPSVLQPEFVLIIHDTAVDKPSIVLCHQPPFPCPFLLYNTFGKEKFDSAEMENRIKTLLMDDDVTKKPGIYPYLL